MEDLFKYAFNDRNEVDEMVDLIRDETLNVGYEMIIENTYDDFPNNIFSNICNISTTKKKIKF